MQVLIEGETGLNSVINEIKVISNVISKQLIVTRNNIQTFFPNKFQIIQNYFKNFDFFCETQKFLIHEAMHYLCLFFNFLQGWLQHTWENLMLMCTVDGLAKGHRSNPAAHRSEWRIFIKCLCCSQAFESLVHNGKGGEFVNSINRFHQVAPVVFLLDGCLPLQAKLHLISLCGQLCWGDNILAKHAWCFGYALMVTPSEKLIGYLLTIW